jgi:hypothetical protein
MPNLLSLPLVEGADSTLFAQQVAGFLDLVGLAVGIWAVWSSIMLPLGGNLQRAFRLIGMGALAFACSHVLDSFIVDLKLVSDEQGLLIMQGAVLLSMLCFVPGLAALADVLPTLPGAQGMASFPRFWPLAVMLMMVIGAFSFILYGISPEAEIVAFIGLDGSISVMACLCIVLLLRARIGGMIGRYLWVAMVALLIFSLAHPAEVWMYAHSGLSVSLLAILHRLLVMPALLLFAWSVTRLSHKLNANLYLYAQQAMVKRAEPQEDQHRYIPKTIFSVRARAYRNKARARILSGASDSRPFPALHQKVGSD